MSFSSKITNTTTSYEGVGKSVNIWHHYWEGTSIITFFSIRGVSSVAIFSPKNNRNKDLRA